MTDHIRRQAVINGLRELATYLEDHPDVPVHPSHTISYSVSVITSDDAAARAEVDRVAQVLGVDPKANGDYYETARKFGSIEYRAVAISQRRMAQYAAEISYRGLVQPEEVGA